MTNATMHDAALFELADNLTAPRYVDAASLEFKVRSTDADTSWLAARISKPAQQSVKDHIVTILTDGPLTDEDVFSLYQIGGGTRTQQRVRTARAELVREGRVRPSTMGRSYAGGPSQKWELT